MYTRMISIPPPSLDGIALTEIMPPPNSVMQIHCGWMDMKSFITELKYGAD